MIALLAVCCKGTDVTDDGQDGSGLTAPEVPAFVRGADVSWVSEMEKDGKTFKTATGIPTDLFKLLADIGLDAVRLRVWVNPRGGYCDKHDVLLKAQRAKALGMDVMIDFHYSDYWADPGKQFIPEAWKEHTYEEMLDDVRQHTLDVLTLLRDGGIQPKWVQVGNETSNGMLWSVKMDPKTGWEWKDENGRTQIVEYMGHLEKNPEQYAGFFKAGYEAVKKVYPDAICIVHLDNGFDRALYDWNLGILRDGGIDYDIVGMSLYPMAAVEWHADKVSSATDAIDKCIANIKHVYEAFGKPCMIAEVGVKVEQAEEGRELLTDVIQKARNQTDGHCLGVLYWEPEAPFNYNGGYDMGAFLAKDKLCQPTVIMDAFAQ